MSTWQVVGNSWRMSISSLSVAGIVAAVNFLLGLIALPFAQQVNVGKGSGVVVGIVLAVANFFLMPLLQGGCLGMANAKLSQNSNVGGITSFRDGATRFYLRLLGFELLTIALMIGFVLLSAVLFVLAMLPATNAPGLSVVLTFIASIPIGIALYVVFLITAMAPVVIAVEDTGVFGAIGKGIRVGRSVLGKLVLVSLVLFLTAIPAILLIVIPAVLDWRVVSLVTQSCLSAVLMIVFVAAYIQVYRNRPAQASNASS